MSEKNLKFIGAAILAVVLFLAATGRLGGYLPFGDARKVQRAVLAKVKANVLDTKMLARTKGANPLLADCARNNPCSVPHGDNFFGILLVNESNQPILIDSSTLLNDQGAQCYNDDPSAKNCRWLVRVGFRPASDGANIEFQFIIQAIGPKGPTTMPSLTEVVTVTREKLQLDNSSSCVPGKNQVLESIDTQGNPSCKEVVLDCQPKRMAWAENAAITNTKTVACQEGYYLAQCSSNQAPHGVSCPTTTVGNVCQAGNCGAPGAGKYWVTQAVCCRLVTR